MTTAKQNGEDVTAALGEHVDLSSPLLLDFGREVSGTLLLRGTGTVDLLFSESTTFRDTGDSTGPADGGAFDISVVTRPDPPIRLALLGDSQWVPSTKGRGGFRYAIVSQVARDGGAAALSDVELSFDAHAFDPMDMAGGFRSTDSELDRAYWCGLYTASLCVVPSRLGSTTKDVSLGAAPELVVDGAKRDRLVWAGDLIVTNRTLETVAGTFQPAIDTLQALADQQMGGQIPAVLPRNSVSDAFLEYTTWWIVEWADHVRRHQDVAFGRATYSQVLSALEYLKGHTDTNGLLTTDLTNGINWSFSVLRLGVTAYQNMLYLLALEAFSDTSKLLGDDAWADQDQLSTLRASIMSHFWDDGRGVFLDLVGTDDHVSEDANSLALLTDLVTISQAKSVLAYLRENHWGPWGSSNVDTPYEKLLYTTLAEHNKRVVPFINYFEVEARLRWGDGAGALELMHRTWGGMLRSSGGNQSTFWEWVGPDGNPEYEYSSLAHGWSSGITSLLGWDLVGARMEGSALVLRPSNAPIGRYRTTLPLAVPLTADVSFTASKQRLDVSSGPEVFVEVWDGPGQSITLNGSSLDATCGAYDMRHVEADVLRIGPLSAPLTLEFSPRPPL